jgi:hypothetical protein
MRHTNLPLQLLAPSVTFAPQSSTARFLWRGISACSAASPAPLVHSPGTCWHLLALAVRKSLRQHKLAHILGFCSRSLSSIRRRCSRGWAALAASAPVATLRTRGEIRPYYLRNSPMMWDESTIAAIEMAAERPTAALRGVCTHVRLSSFAWRRQGMSPRMRRAPPAQGL